MIELKDILESGDIEKLVLKTDVDEARYIEIRRSDDSVSGYISISANGIVITEADDTGTARTQLTVKNNGQVLVNNNKVWHEGNDGGDSDLNAGMLSGHRLADFSMRSDFHYAQAENIDIATTDPDWTDVLTLTIPDAPAGTYKLDSSVQFTINSTSNSFIYRFSLDGGATWGPEYQKEVKDRSNTEILEVLNVIEHTGGTLDIRIQCTREGTPDCTVIKALMTAELKIKSAV